MSITAITPATDTDDYQVASSSTAEASLMKDDFLDLLLVQLQNQDPLNPVDTETFTAQLCSLSQLEQATITNSHLEEMMTSVTRTQAVSYIGKSLDIEENIISVCEGVAEELTFKLADDASQVYLTVYDKEGNAVWSEESANMDAGTFSMSWADVNEQEDGDYTFEVMAYDSDGNSVTAIVYTSVEVTGVVYGDGETYLVADDKYISLDDLTEIHKS